MLLRRVCVTDCFVGFGLRRCDQAVPELRSWKRKPQIKWFLGLNSKKIWSKSSDDGWACSQVKINIYGTTTHQCVPLNKKHIKIIDFCWMKHLCDTCVRQEIWILCTESISVTCSVSRDHYFSELYSVVPLTVNNLNGRAAASCESTAAAPALRRADGQPHFPPFTEFNLHLKGKNAFCSAHRPSEIQVYSIRMLINAAPEFV